MIWPDVVLANVALINPPEKLARGTVAPFIEMASVAPDCGGVQRVASKTFIGSGSRFKEGDSLVARITPCLENGKIAVVPHLNADVGFGSTEFIVLRGDGQASTSPFIRYLAMDPRFREYAEQNLIGSSGRQRVAPDVVGQYRFCLPPLKEQERIAGLLGAFDNLIDTNRRLIVSLEQLVHTLFADAGFDSLSRWDTVTTVGQLISINPKIAKPKGLAPYVDMAMVPTSSALLDVPKDRTASSGARFQNGDTLLARITPCLENGKTAYVTNLDEGGVGVGSTEFIVLRGEGGLAGIWTYALARSPRFRAFAIQQLGDGSSGRQRLSADAVAGYAVPQPPAADFIRFRQRTQSLVDAMTRLHTEVLDLTRQRDELLPLLMSGRARVREVEAVGLP